MSPASLLGRLVACTWKDAHGDVKAEMGPEDIAAATSYKFTSFGILVRDDRGRAIDDPVVGIAHEHGEDGRFRGVTWIPTGMVLEILDRGARVPRKPRGGTKIPVPHDQMPTATDPK